MARNKARGQVVSDEQIADNWDKNFNKSKQEKKIMDGLIFIIVVGVVVGGIILKTENPNALMKKLKHNYKLIGKTLEHISNNNLERLFEVYPFRIGLCLPIFLAITGLVAGMIIL